MSQVLEGKITKRTKSRIRIEITKESFESFCNAIGLYRKEFLDALDASERDHRSGHLTRRKSLHELRATPFIRLSEPRNYIPNTTKSGAFG